MKAVPSRCVAGLLLAGALALAGCKVETFWAPDGKTIAYLADGQLRLYDVASKQSRPLDTGAGRVISAAWAPGGQQIAYYAATLGKDASVTLRALEPTTGKTAPLVLDVWPLPRQAPAGRGQSSDQALREAQEEELGTFDYLARLAWSPDGKRIAYVGASDQEAGVFILTYPAQGIKAVERDKQVGMQVTPAWSPDGKWLAYALVVSAGTAPGGASEPAADSVWLCDLATGKSAKVCDAPGEALAVGTRLVWSRDSRQIGFIAAGEEQGAGIGCLVEARPGAAPRKAVTGISALAAWSPSLEGVAYVGEPPEENATEAPLLYRAVGPAAPKTLGKLPLPRQPAGAAPQEGESLPFSLPEFSPDGAQVALRVGEGAAAKVMVFAAR